MKYFFLYILFSFVYLDDFKNVKVLDLKTKSEMKKYMKQISKDLGVRCSHCHDLDDKSIDNPQKEITREMILLTKYLNDTLNSVSSEHKDYKTHISCWTCHHGNLKPEHVRPSK
tara:strand:- start:911 stop:1252 length:342 start_codon:yes stop_codon:yes gene_type:complete